MQNENWFFEQCLKCRHLITKKNMNTGKKTYACDNGVALVKTTGLSTMSMKTTLSFLRLKEQRICAVHSQRDS